MVIDLDNTLDKIDVILRHIENVRDNCTLLGKRLIETGEIELGKRLIANGLTHDYSKFFGTEWENLNTDSTKLRLEISINQHNTTNPHHPEFWGSIHEMPKVAVAEMVADWHARATEFGTSVRDWIENGAAQRYGYQKGDKVYKLINKFVDILCDKTFKPIKKS